jgi:PAS domain S-box-containing protein
MSMECDVGELRKTGISVIGDVPWGAHLCHFYETKEDLLDILIPYFRAGLENNEFCVWVVSDPLGEEEARNALRQVIPEADRYLEAGRLEIVPHTRFLSARERTSSPDRIDVIPHTDWYLKDGAFIAERVLSGWSQKLAAARARGYAGLRANGNEAWLTAENWEAFSEYEKTLDQNLAGQRMIVLCSYPVTGSSAAQVFDVLNTHRFGILRRRGKWERIETPEPIQAKAEIKRLNKELRRALDKRSEPPAILRYGVAVLSVIAAVITLLLLDTSLQAAAHVSLFLCAVIFSTWFGGIRPGLLAIALSVLGFAYVLPPPDSFAVEIPHLPRLLLFALLAFFVGSLTAAQRNKAASLRRARDVLDGTVQQLKRTNEALRREIVERKLAEEAVRRAENRIRLVIDTIPTMAWSLRPDGVLDFINQRWLDYAGLSLQDAIEEPMGTVHPEDLPRVMEKWQKDMAAGEPYKDEMRLRRADGEYRWFLTRTAPLRDEQGNIVKWFGSGIDIEDRKEAEDALRESEERFTAFMDNLPGYAWMKDLQGCYVYVNEMVKGLPGYRSLGKTDAQIWPADLAAEYRANDEQVIAAKKPLHTLEHYQLKGKQRYMAGSKFPIFDKTGAVALVGGAGVDITERIEAEGALRESEQRFRRLVEVMPVAVYVCDTSGIIQIYNHRAVELWGREPKPGDTDQRYCGSLRLYSPDGKLVPHRESPMAEALRTGLEARDGELIVERPDGSRVTVLANIVLLRNGDGQLIGAMNCFQDITERREAAKELEEANQQLRFLSRRLFHIQEEERRHLARELHDEIGQTLTAAKLNLKMIAPNVPAAEAGRLKDSIQLLDRLLVQVRQLSLDLRPPLLDELGLLPALRWLADQQAQRAQLHATFTAKVDGLKIDPVVQTACFRVAQEAITNVIRHSGAKSVAIDLRCEADRLWLSVRDDGAGFDAGAIERRTATRSSLGLVSMKERALLVRGGLKVRSAPGEGTEIRAWFPLMSQETNSNTEAA